MFSRDARHLVYLQQITFLHSWSIKPLRFVWQKIGSKINQSLTIARNVCMQNASSYVLAVVTKRKFTPRILLSVKEHLDFFSFFFNFTNRSWGQLWHRRAEYAKFVWASLDIWLQDQCLGQNWPQDLFNFIIFRTC